MCKYYLCGLDVTCFKNTRSDGDIARVVGVEAAEKIRDDGAREAFESAPAAERAKTGYERATKDKLDELIRECDRRIQRGMVRAKQEREEAERKAATSAEADMLRLLEQKIRDAAEKAEKLGEEGDVDGAEKEAEHLEMLQTRYDEMKKKFESLDGWRLTEPCPVSGTLLCSTDTEERRKDHLEGKQYKGWTHIRKLRDELAARLAKYEEDGLIIGGSSSANDGSQRNRWRGDRRSRSPDHTVRDRPRSRSRDRARDREHGRDRDGRRYEPYRRYDDRGRGGRDDDRRYRRDRY